MISGLIIPTDLGNLRLRQTWSGAEPGNPKAFDLNLGSHNSHVTPCPFMPTFLLTYVPFLDVFPGLRPPGIHYHIVMSFHYLFHTVCKTICVGALLRTSVCVEQSIELLETKETACIFFCIRPSGRQSVCMQKVLCLKAPVGQGLCVCVRVSLCVKALV